MSMFGTIWVGAEVLDCYAGSGAFGFEAISRGAEHVTFIERHSRTALNIKNTAKELEVTSQVHVLRERAESALKTLSRGQRRFDVLFFDPPYAESRPIDVLSHAFRLAKPGAALIWESGAELEVPENIGDWQLEVNRRYGSTKIAVYRSNMRGT
jgi:16S rRNA (guanine(966)-N(2))-methyltransferase RsmD